MFIPNFHSIAVKPSSLTGSATNLNVYAIAESGILNDQLAPVPLIHTATSCRTNLLPLPRRISGSDIPMCHRGAAAMEPWDTLAEPVVPNAPLPPDLHAIWACYARIIVTGDQLK